MVGAMDASPSVGVSKLTFVLPTVLMPQIWIPENRGSFLDFMVRRCGTFSRRKDDAENRFSAAPDLRCLNILSPFRKKCKGKFEKNQIKV